MVGGEGLLDASDEMQTTSGKVTYCSESYSSTLGGQGSRMLGLILLVAMHIRFGTNPR